MRVGASRSPTSENRNSISSARPFEWMFARHDEEVRRVRAEADVDVPSGIAGVDRGTGTAPGTCPSPQVDASVPADQLIERGVQPRRVRGLDEWRLCEHPQPDDRLVHVLGIVRVAPGRLPENRSGRVRERAREGVVDSHESVGDELLDLRGLEPAHQTA